MVGYFTRKARIIQFVFCPRCQSPLVPGAAFCSVCQTPLAAAGAAPIVVTLGREVDNTICIEADQVSRYHARVIVQGGVMTIEDLGSANGVTVNGRPVQSAAISLGDEIYLGSFRFNNAALAPYVQAPAAPLHVQPVPPVQPSYAHPPPSPGHGAPQPAAAVPAGRAAAQTIPPPASESELDRLGQILTEQQVRLFGLIGAYALGAMLFLPWAIVNDEVIFSWRLTEIPDSEGFTYLLVWMLLSAVVMAPLCHMKQLDTWICGLVGALLGVGGVVGLYVVSPVTEASLFRSSQAANPTEGIIAVAGFVIVAFGCVYRATNERSAMARVLLGLGILLMAVTFVVPHEVAGIRVVPITTLLEAIAEAADHSFFVTLLLVAFLLPFPMALASIAGLLPVAEDPGRMASEDPKTQIVRVLGVAFVAYYPFLGFLGSLGLWIEGELPIFAILFLGIIVGVQLGWTVFGTAVCAGHVASKIAGGARAGGPLTGSSDGPASRLERLDQLRSSGVLSEAEYQRKRADIISDL